MLIQLLSFFTATISLIYILPCSLNIPISSPYAYTSITFFNPLAEQITEWSHQEALTRPFQEVFRLIHETAKEEDEAALHFSPTPAALTDPNTPMQLMTKQGLQRIRLGLLSAVHCYNPVFDRSFASCSIRSIVHFGWIGLGRLKAVFDFVLLRKNSTSQAKSQEK